MNKHFAYLKSMYALPFRVIARAMRLFFANRGRLQRFMQNPRVASFFRKGIIITAVVWLIIALIAPDDQTDRLGEAVKQLWSPLKN